MTVLIEAKHNGFSDEQICRILKDGTQHEEIYERRKKMGSDPCI